ncbi:MAG: hypothetical protein JHC26_04655 [Thermofilum sp.]|jgi:hypothetical protein|uniref:hypothetical protein n=1 Tax=Thermofilum sp. TaxID=1961369 RepID=UPI002588498A|nr:hypothetical protein [Thermofilum sp.]MCI4408358.1 hypothetical protein [Thermofilum sp.]
MSEKEPEIDTVLRVLLDSIESQAYTFDIAKVRRVMEKMGKRMSNPYIARMLAERLDGGKVVIVDNRKRVWEIEYAEWADKKDRRRYYARVIGEVKENEATIQ